MFEITSDFVWQAIQPRPRDAHKGTFGSVLAVAGSASYRGAAALAVEGALRTGAGIVTLASVEPVLAAVAARLPECCLCPCEAGAEGGISPQNIDRIRRQKASVLLAGPGLGYTAQSAARAAETRALVKTLLPDFSGSAVLDADGLNAAADLLQTEKMPHPQGELILTPHPGEMARLTGRSAAEINADREGTALRYAKVWNAVVVLKGAHTVIAGPDGRCAVNPTGNPGLSRGGSGDVLAGMTSALLACGLPAFEAAACAVYLHGAAADRAAALHGETGMLPHDLLDALGTLFAERNASFPLDLCYTGAIQNTTICRKGSVSFMVPALEKIIAESDRIVFFGGAGVSTESGIPDFRSVDGLYHQKYDYPPETILSHTFWEENPEEFYRFYRDKLIVKGAKPNAAHLRLAKLEREGKLKAIVTQNIDGLHQAAGAKTVYELHGSTLRNYCVKCGTFYDVDFIANSTGVPRCPKCGGIVKPDVVLYEEGLDEEVLSGAVSAIRKADTLIIGGTSLVVYPAAGLIRYFRGSHLVVINMQPTGADAQADLCIAKPIGQVLSEDVLLED